ncbi:MAG: hypothetical protein JNJ54_10400 [Myxococcaceae bacterium]|nr:hypothetical protein [Myxococcaceae bacterium]
MGFKGHALFFGALGALFGVSELLAPAQVLGLFSVEADAGAVLMARVGAGPLNLGFGLSAFLAASTRDVGAQRAVLSGGLAYAVAASAASVFTGLPDLASPLMWSMLAIAVPLGVNAARLLLTSRRSGSAV